MWAVPLWDKSALLWADWKNELVPVLPGARGEHRTFSAIKVFNKGQITSLVLKKSDTWANYSIPFTLCNIKGKLNREVSIFSSYHSPYDRLSSVHLHPLSSHHNTLLSLGCHWHLWQTHINQRWFFVCLLAFGFVFCVFIRETQSWMS